MALLAIDGHVHLHDFDDPAPVIRRAVQSSVIRMVSVGMDRESNRRSLELAERFPYRVLPAVGYHPWSIRAEEVEATLEDMAKQLPRCVALGEVGLDYRVKVKKELQKEVFSRALELAREQDRPVIVHSRFSHQRCLSMVLEEGVRRAVFHWYSGPEDVLDRILDAGYYVSATPALALRTKHRSAMERAPLDRILVETDAPVRYQGRRAEPVHVWTTLKALAEIKNRSLEEITRRTTENALAFFGLGPLEETPPCDCP
ncbi:TatD DNase family protein [Desulfacinum hydrothermale DSM 13146]|uniref:TatD DNase family protein n=1 Tax=Desulfacinum hydrothermale DSM 13146 TaxID=1121390 RepID=A0A1W1XQQ0_9BACT|nr:TatD family hydrolase [Desulfacinum hydrothermale]SMC25841.1 TatD DNase family protein [Desulfacinum hydrothermale DSM 13146]